MQMAERRNRWSRRPRTLPCYYAGSPRRGPSSVRGAPQQAKLDRRDLRSLGCKLDATAPGILTALLVVGACHHAAPHPAAATPADLPGVTNPWDWPRARGATDHEM